MDKNLKELEDIALIEIIENPENEASPLKSQAKDELQSRKLLSETIKEMAMTVNATIAYERVSNEDHSTEEVSMHESNFLEEEEIRKIYLDQLEKLIKYKNQFRFDVWSYAIGGI